MRPKQKLLLYIKFINNSDQISYSITPSMIHTNTVSAVHIYEYMFDSGDMTFQVKLDTILSGQALVITKIQVNDIDITTGMDRFGTYITDNNKKKKTYGYMDEPGTYKFKIRHNVMYTQYMSYLLGQIT